MTQLADEKAGSESVLKREAAERAESRLAGDIMPEPHPEQIGKVLQALPDGYIDVLDQLAYGLAAQQLDRVQQVARNREKVDEIIRQLGATTNIVTTMANILGVSLDDAPVEPSSNFVKWNAPRIRALAVHCISYCESLERHQVQARAETEAARHTMDELTRKAEELSTKAATTNSTTEAALQTLRDSVQALNLILSQYNDQQSYLVAKVDPVTQTPLKFYIEVEEDDDDDYIIRTVKAGHPDLTGISLVEAKTLRANVLQGLRAKTRRTDFSSLSDTVAVFQMSLHRVNLEAEYDDAE